MKVMILLLIAIVLSLGLISVSDAIKLASTTPDSNIKELVEMYEARIKERDNQIADLEDILDKNDEFHWEYQDKRCLCVNYHSSANEPALSKEYICKNGE